jgi:hypothetical protein
MISSSFPMKLDTIWSVTAQGTRSRSEDHASTIRKREKARRRNNFTKRKWRNNNRR